MSSFRGFACVLFAGVLLVCLQTSQAHHETVEKCMVETGATADDLTDFAEGKEPSNNFKCLVKCCMRHHDLINDDGVINKDLILGALPATYTSWLNSCFPSDAPDASRACEIAYNFNKCLAESSPEKYAQLAEYENN